MPMSEVACRLAVEAAANHLESPAGGPGLLPVACPALLSRKSRSSSAACPAPGTEAAKRELSITSRTAASLNSGEYLPRWLDTIRSIQLPQFYFGGPCPD